MTDAIADAAGAGDSKSGLGKTGLMIGLALALIGGGGGFYAVQSGLLPFGGTASGTQHDSHDTSAAHGAPAAHGSAEGGHEQSHSVVAGNVAFVDVAPITISLRDSTVADFLRFRMQLEVAAGSAVEVEHLRPRIIDLLNGYLRALAPEDFEDPMILPRLRSQILRRVQIVAGPEKVHDVLIMEFILN